MKTQITSLIDGRKDVRIDPTNEKYINAPKASSHTGFGGTNSKIRQEIGERVIAENPDGLHILAFGKEFFLRKETSLSGKTGGLPLHCPPRTLPFLPVTCPNSRKGSKLNVPSISAWRCMWTYIAIRGETRGRNGGNAGTNMSELNSSPYYNITAQWKDISCSNRRPNPIAGFAPTRRMALSACSRIRSLTRHSRFHF